MVYLITYDDGHGIDTAGKRTPNFADGTYMRENEFNKAVANYFAAEWQYTDSVILFNCAPEETDTPLKTRIDRANAKVKEVRAKYGVANVKAIHVSFHANAYLGYWGTWGGQGTFYYPTSAEGKKLANSVLAELVKGTALRDRGAKGADFYVLRETITPSVLIEAAFMDNLAEAKLLRTDAFRREVAREVAAGVANYFGIKVAPKPEPVAEPINPNIFYRVVAGSYNSRALAEERQAELAAKGFTSFLTTYTKEN